MIFCRISLILMSTNSNGVLLSEACVILNVYACIQCVSYVLRAGIRYDATSFVSTSIPHSIPIVFLTINCQLDFLADQGIYDEQEIWY